MFFFLWKELLFSNICSLSYWYCFFVKPCNLILHKINVQILKRKKNIVQNTVTFKIFMGDLQRKPWCWRKWCSHLSGWHFHCWVSAAPVQRCWRCFRWNGKAKCCGHQRFPRKNSIPRNSYCVLQFYLSEVHIISAAEDFVGWCSCISWQYTHPRMAAFYWCVK